MRITEYACPADASIFAYKEVRMRKLRLVSLIMVLSLVLWGSILAQGEEVSITEQNVAQLRGAWKGEWKSRLRMRGGTWEWVTNAAELIVENNPAPLKATVKIQRATSGEDYVYPNGIGSIEGGKLLIKWVGGRQALLSLDISKDEMKLSGDMTVNYMGQPATLQLKFVKGKE